MKEWSESKGDSGVNSTLEFNCVLVSVSGVQSTDSQIRRPR